MICVGRGPEAKGWGSCPLNSDWMKCSCQLEIKWPSEFVNQHEGNATQLKRCHCRTLTCVAEGSCLGSGTTPCPRTHWQAGLQGPSEGLDPWQCDGILGRGPKGRGSLQTEKKITTTIMKTNEILHCHHKTVGTADDCRKNIKICGTGSVWT